MCTVTLVPDDRDYDINTWMSSPTFSDDDLITTRTSQGQSTRIERFSLVLVINMKAVTHVEQV